jgi:tetratricopeptide (TPR) repeat protein
MDAVVAELERMWADQRARGDKASRGPGRHDQAPASIVAPVGIDRPRAEAQPEAFLPDLARQLYNQSFELSEQGHHEEALGAIQKAVAMVQAQPDAFRPDLATSLNIQFVVASGLGSHEVALAALDEADDVYRRLAEARPDAFPPDIASSLFASALYDRSIELSGLGRREEALAAIVAAVAIRRRLVQAQSDTFLLPDLAISLDHQSVVLSELGRHEVALPARVAAVAILRRLAEAQPGVYLPALASSLDRQSYELSALGRHEEAFAASEEAAAVRQRLGPHGGGG